MPESMRPEALRKALTDGDEFALLDVRERGEFARRHLFLAINLPLSRLELHIRRYVPRRSARLVLCDGGDGRSERAATIVEAAGYSGVSIVAGGAPACAAAGMEMFRGHYAVTYAFALHVLRSYHPPVLTAHTLRARRDAGEPLVVLDARPPGDYQHASIPGAIDLPLSELTHRIRDVVPDPATPIVVNCGAITRGVLGCCTLIEAGVANPVAVLENGVRGWALAGYALEHGADRTAGTTSPEAVAWARAATKRLRSRCRVTGISRAQLQRWRDDASRTLFVVDVRTREEYEAGHLPDAIWVLGGELIGLYEDHIGMCNARVCLVDDDGSRAAVTASWLTRLGWPDVAVLEGGVAGHALVSGPEVADVPRLEQARTLPHVSVATLHEAIGKGQVLVLDVTGSNQYAAGHIPGAWWANRASLPALIDQLPQVRQYVITAHDTGLACLTALDLHPVVDAPVAVLSGGTGAWCDAGFELACGLTRTLGEVVDVLPEVNTRWGDDRTTVLDAQRRMVQWQDELLDKLARDDTFSFPELPVP